MSWSSFIRADISPQAKVIYLYLEEFMARHKRVFVRQATIGKDLKLSKRTIARCIKELTEANMISRKRLKSSCDYYVHLGLLHSDKTNMAYISKHTNTNNNTKRKMPDVSYLGKNLKYSYKSAVQDIKGGKKLKKTDQLLKDKFFTHMKSRGDMATFWKKLIDGEIEWPEELPRLGKA